MDAAREAILEAAIAAYDATMKRIGGCSDGYCSVTGPAKGMHTNGGCRCHKDVHKANRVMAAGRRLRETISEMST